MQSSENSIINSVETEQSVLGSIMYSPTIFPRLYGVLKTPDFYHPDHRQIYASMQRLHEAGLDINIKTIENDLQRANITIGTELKELLDYRVSTEVALSFASQVAEFAGYRTLQREIENLLPSIKQRDKNLSDYTTELTNIVRKVSGLGISTQFVSGDELVEKYLEMLTHERGEYDLTGIPELDEKIFDFSPKELTFISARPGVGKALTLDTDVLTPDGWVRNGDLKVGSKVIGSKGTPVTVLGVYPQGMRDVYRVTFYDNTYIDCDLEHLWTLDTGETITTEEMIERRKNGSVFVPMTATVQGTSNIMDSTYEYYQLGMEWEGVPEDLITKPLSVREAFIQGVMDYHTHREGNSYTLPDYDPEILDVLRSVGALVIPHGWDLHIQFTTNTSIIPFRKNSKLMDYLYDCDNVEPKKPVNSITPLGIQAPMQCIEVDSPDHLYVVAGYVLTHNTAIMLQSVITNMKKGATIGFVSMEMDSSKLTNRLVSHLVGIDSTLLRKLTPAQAVETPEVLEALKFLSNGQLHIEDRGPFTIEVVSNKIRTMVYEYGCDIVYVDYLGLISAKGKDKNAEVTKISRDLKEVAMELEIPIVVAVQLNRDTLKNPNAKPQLHNLRDSGSIEQDATTVLFLYPDIERMSMGGMTGDDIENYLNTTMEVPIKFYVAKQRNGPNEFTMDVLFNKPTGSFHRKTDPY